MAIATQQEGTGAGSQATAAVGRSFGRLTGFFSDVRNETKKLSTPSRKEVQATTAVVLITVALFGVYFFLIDWVIGYGMQRLLDFATK